MKTKLPDNIKSTQSFPIRQFLVAVLSFSMSYGLEFPNGKKSTLRLLVSSIAALTLAFIAMGLAIAGVAYAFLGLGPALLSIPVFGVAIYFITFIIFNVVSIVIAGLLGASLGAYLVKQWCRFVSALNHLKERNPTNSHKFSLTDENKQFDKDYLNVILNGLKVKALSQKDSSQIEMKEAETKSPSSIKESSEKEEENSSAAKLQKINVDALLKAKWDIADRVQEGICQWKKEHRGGGRSGYSISKCVGISFYANPVMARINEMMNLMLSYTKKMDSTFVTMEVCENYLKALNRLELKSKNSSSKEGETKRAETKVSDKVHKLVETYQLTCESIWEMERNFLSEVKTSLLSITKETTTPDRILVLSESLSVASPSA